MSSIYLVYNVAEITDEIISHSGFVSSTPIEVFTNTGSDTGFRVVKVKKGYDKSPVYAKKTRFSESDIKSVISDLSAGKKVNIDYTVANKNTVFQDPEGNRARFTGGFNLSIPAGETRTQDFVLQEDRIITGTWYSCSGTNIGDKVSFSVVDLNFTYAGILYAATPYEQGISVPESLSWSDVAPQGVVIDEFIKDWYVADTSHDLIAYPARLLAGLCLRLTYNNIGSSPSAIVANLYLHKQR